MMSQLLLNKVGDIISHAKLGPGNWIVVKAHTVGAGYGDGNEYGHRITCYPLVAGSNEVNNKVPAQKFFQSGEFNHNFMLPYVQPSKQVQFELTYQLKE